MLKAKKTMAGNFTLEENATLSLNIGNSTLEEIENLGFTSEEGILIQDLWRYIFEGDKHYTVTSSFVSDYLQTTKHNIYTKKVIQSEVDLLKRYLNALNIPVSKKEINKRFIQNASGSIIIDLKKIEAIIGLKDNTYRVILSCGESLFLSSIKTDSDYMDKDLLVKSWMEIKK